MKSVIYRSGRTHRKGLGLVWSVLILLALCGLASMAVDFGRVTLAKTQLRSAADAAALAAGQVVLSDPATVRSVAIDIAKKNKVDGTELTLLPGDIEIGHWDASAKTFTVTSTNVNAVRVSAHRNTARGNAIDLPFAKLIGANTCDVKATAIAMAKVQRYAAIGLDYVKMGGNASNGYRKAGSFDQAGSLYSNGDITLSGSSWVQGDAHPGVGRRVIGANHVSGSTTPLTTPLVYPMPNVGNAASVNDNNLIPSTVMSAGVLKMGNQKIVTLPGGVYYLKGIDMGAGSQLIFSGPATVYVNGAIKLGGHVKTYADEPLNLKLIGLGTQMIDLNGGSAMYVDLYAPGMPIDIHGTGDIYGGIVAKSISMTGNSAIHYDLKLNGGVSLVK